jgi:hypothetical protein
MAGERGYGWAEMEHSPTSAPHRYKELGRNFGMRRMCE